MRLLDIFENDSEHAAALRTTGFWGNRAAGALLFAADTKRFLIALRSQQVEQPGTFGTIGGAIDDDEDELVAAKREAVEELGYSGRIIGAKPVYRFEKTNDEGQTIFSYQNFILVIPQEIPEDQFTLNWESTAVRWADLEELTGIASSPRAHFGLKALLSDAKTVSIMQQLVGTRRCLF